MDQADEYEVRSPDGRLLCRGGRRGKELEELFAVARVYHPDGFVETESMNPGSGRGKIAVRYYPDAAAYALVTDLGYLPVLVTVLGETIFGGDGRETMGHLFLGDPGSLLDLRDFIIAQGDEAKRFTNSWGSCLVLARDLQVALTFSALGQEFNIRTLRKFSLDLGEDDEPLKATLHVKFWD